MRWPAVFMAHGSAVSPVFVAQGATPPVAQGAAPAVQAPAPAASSGAGGWFYNLLVHSGLDPSTAHTVNDLVVRPIEVLLVVVLGVLAAHWGAKAIERVLGRLASPATERLVSPRASARITTVVGLVANAWRFTIAVVVLAVILTIFGINLTPLLASATVLGATIGFGAQSLVRDYLSGILLTVEDQFGVGDTISVNDTTGVVEGLSLRVTRVRDPEGGTWYLPNGDIRRLANTSRGWVEASVDLPVAAGSPSDIDRAKDLLLTRAKEVVRRPALLAACPEPPRMPGLVAADADALTLRVTVRTTSAHAGEVERTLREELVRTLMTAGLWPGGQAAVSAPDTLGG